MALTRFSFQPNVQFQGLNDFSPKELETFTLELERRLTQTVDPLINAIRNQCLVDQDILPDLTSGSSDASTQQIMTTRDVEDARSFAMMWNA